MILIAGQAVANIMMVGGLLPVVGVPLPFISYGGTSIFCTVVIFAIIQGIYILRHNENEIYVEDFDLEQDEVMPARRNEGGAEEVLKRHMSRQQNRPQKAGAHQTTQPKKTRRQAAQEENKGFWDEEEDRVQKGKRKKKRTPTEYEEKW